MSNTALPPTGLLCNLLRQPELTVLHDLQPHFSWIVNDQGRDMHQTRWRILVATSLAELGRDHGDRWDSEAGRPPEVWTTDSRSLAVPYLGQALQAGKTYFWKVMTWNSRHQPSPWSAPQSFTIGDAAVDGLCDAHPVVQVPEAPVAAWANGPDSLFVDFGRSAFGTLAIDWDGHAAGELEVVLGEVLAGAGRINRTPGGSRRCRTLRLAVSAGVARTYQLAIPPDERNTRQVTDAKASAAILMPPSVGEVTPFRYGEIHGPGAGILAASQIRRLGAWVPFDEQAASFHSSDPTLDAIWELCRYSMRATSFCGYHVDGDRERIPYEGDAYINQLCHCCCDREYALSRRTHEYLLTHPTWPTEYMLFSVLMAWHDYEFTGDRRSLERHVDLLAAKTLAALAREDGLISTMGTVTPEILASVHQPVGREVRDLVDWPQGERDGYELRPVNTVVNALHAEALRCMARITTALGRPEEAADWQRRHEQVRAAMLAKLRHPATGVFVDGEGSTHSALHAVAFPLAFGLLPAEEVPAALAFLRRKGMACSVYAAQILLDALYAAGDGDTAYALMTGGGDRGWRHWLENVGTTITLEAWDDRYKPNQDWNHAWGAAPANIIPRQLMGVTPLEPGFGYVRIKPQPGPLEFAALKLPTVRGAVEVCLRQHPGQDFHLTTRLPANMTAQVWLPDCGHEGVMALVDGQPAAASWREPGWLVFDRVGSGGHSFQR